MDYFGTFLILVLAIKIQAIMRSIVWVARHGEAHCESLSNKHAHSDLGEEEFFSSFQHCDGNFWPFRMKDHKLRSYIKKLRINSIASTKNHARSFVATILNDARITLFHYVSLSLIAASFVAFAAITWRFS